MRPGTLLSSVLPHTSSVSERLDYARTAINQEVLPSLENVGERLESTFPQAPSWRTASAHLFLKRMQITGQRCNESVLEKLAAGIADTFSPSKAQKEQRYLAVKARLESELAEQDQLLQLVDVHRKLDALHTMLHSGPHPAAPESLPSPYDYAYARLCSSSDFAQDMEVLQDRLDEYLHNDRLAALEMMQREYLEQQKTLLARMTPSLYLTKASRQRLDLSHIRKFPERIAQFAQLQTIENELRRRGLNHFQSGMQNLPEVFHQALAHYAESPEHRQWVRQVNIGAKRQPARLILLQKELRNATSGHFTGRSDRRVRLAAEAKRLEQARPPVVTKTEDNAKFLLRDRHNAISAKESNARRAVYSHRLNEMTAAKSELETIETILEKLKRDLGSEPGALNVAANEAARLASQTTRRLWRKIGWGADGNAGSTAVAPSANDEAMRQLFLVDIELLLKEVRAMKDMILPPAPLDGPGGPRTLRERFRDYRLKSGWTVGETVRANAQTLQRLRNSPRLASALTAAMTRLDGIINR